MQFTTFEHSEGLASWLADHVSDKLAKAINEKGSASLAVSGGSTPLKFFRALSKAKIDWAKVSVILVDERWVPPTSKRSNQRLVTIELLQDNAADAKLVPLYDEAIDATEIGSKDAEFSALLPIDVMILGMGADGHTASLFPGGNNLGAATSDDCDTVLMSMEAPDAGEPRVTLTLPVITNASELVLHIEGDKKKEVLETASLAGDPAALPIRFVLAKRPDLRIVWAP